MFNYPDLILESIFKYKYELDIDGREILLAIENEATNIANKLGMTDEFTDEFKFKITINKEQYKINFYCGIEVYYHMLSRTIPVKWYKTAIVSCILNYRSREIKIPLNIRW